MTAGVAPEGCDTRRHCETYDAQTICTWIAMTSAEKSHMMRVTFRLYRTTHRYHSNRSHYPMGEP